jgi:hypothetical protein
MYIITYGADILHDPRTDAVVTAGALSMCVNTAASLRFTIQRTHPLYGVLALLDKGREVVCERDGEVLFCGRILAASTGFSGAATYECEGELAYLNDAVLRPYSTDEGHPNRAPGTVDGLFAWYVAQYNTQVPEQQRFEVGVNEGAQMDPNNQIRRASQQYPNVGQEIKSKLLDSLGGNIRVRHVRGARLVDWLAGGDVAASQRIEFGRNLLDYARSLDGLEVATSCIPVGRGEDGGDVTIASVPDGPLEVGYMKLADSVVAVDAAARFGVIERVLDCPDTTQPDNLVAAALRRLKNTRIAETIVLKAIDLSMIDPSVRRIGLAEYVRVTAAPFGIDEYYVCTQIDCDLADPANDSYTIGKAYSTLTGRQVSDLASLNEGINKSYDAAQMADAKAAQADARAAQAGEAAAQAVEASGEARAAAEQAEVVSLNAEQAANSARDKADASEQKADDALARASAAQDAAAEAAAAALAASQAADAAHTLAEAARNEQQLQEVLIANNAQAAADAAAEALKALAMAGSKAKVWTAEPVPPYAQDDLWAQGEEGSVLVCVNARAEGEGFDADDWQAADGYASKTALAALATTTSVNLETTAGSILAQVAESYATSSDLGHVSADLSSKLELTAQQMQLTFSEQAAAIGAVADGLAAESAERAAYIRFSIGGMEIGREGSPSRTVFDNTHIGFIVGDSEVTSISNTGIATTAIESRSGIVIGAGNLGLYDLSQRSNANLSLRWRGGAS